jgi:hypothetical protein
MIASRVNPDAPWAQRLMLIEEALAAGTMSRALNEWHEAHAEAFKSGRWEALVAVGDAAARIEAATGTATGFLADARRLYMAALLLARAEHSGVGVRQIADALAALGDYALAAHALRVAREIC